MTTLGYEALREGAFDYCIVVTSGSSRRPLPAASVLSQSALPSNLDLNLRNGSLG